MAKLTWDQPDQREYEVGIDRGVLFPTSTYGVAWSGLNKVTEKSAGGEPTSYYLDGKRMQTTSSVTEFSATIEAYQAPTEFNSADGIKKLSPGLFQTHQKRNKFAFSYRTKLGNNVLGSDYGYKLHIVYNAYAQPAERKYTTQTESVELLSLSWDVDAVAPIISGVNPTAHLVISSKKYGTYVLDRIEAILYGDDDNISRLPTIEDIQSIFASSGYGHGPYGHLPYGA